MIDAKRVLFNLRGIENCTYFNRDLLAIWENQGGI